jgi:hypothetical protein
MELILECQVPPATRAAARRLLRDAYTPADRIDSASVTPDHDGAILLVVAVNRGNVGDGTVEEVLGLPGTPAWTIARVKAELPALTVYGVWGTNIPAVVRGRVLPFARVHFRIGGQPYSCEVAWQTIVTALNTGQPVHL